MAEGAKTRAAMHIYEYLTIDPIACENGVKSNFLCSVLAGGRTGENRVQSDSDGAFITGIFFRGTYAGHL